MKIHSVIIDDEVSGVRSLQLLIEKFIPSVKVIATTTDAIEGISMINNFRPDLVFLDIKMPVADGFQVLEQLEFRNFHLVFSTAHREFALKALKLNASDYLLKPVDISELKSTVERITQKMVDKLIPDVSDLLKELFVTKNIRIPLHTKNNIEYLTPDKIIYIEAVSNHSNVYLLSGNRETVSFQLKDYEELCCNDNRYFMRIHNSFIVNINYIVRYLKKDGGYVVMQDNKTIPVSKHKKQELFDRINIQGLQNQ